MEYAVYTVNNVLCIVYTVQCTLCNVQVYTRFNANTYDGRISKYVYHINVRTSIVSDSINSIVQVFTLLYTHMVIV